MLALNAEEEELDLPLFPSEIGVIGTQIAKRKLEIDFP